MTAKYEYDESQNVAGGEEQKYTVPITILDGKYIDTTFTFGKVNFREVDDDVQCNFTYKIDNKPEGLQENQEFINCLGDILVDVLSKEIEEVEGDFLNGSKTN